MPPPRYTHFRLNSLELLWPDDATRFDIMTDENDGFKNRKLLAAGSQEIHFRTILKTPLFMQDKLIIPGTKLTMTIRQSDGKSGIRCDVFFYIRTLF